LLVRTGTRTILFETGIGTFFAPELRDRYGVVEERHVLLDNLAALGVAPDDVDVVVLSHLHFDHAGGALTAWQPEAAPALVFPRAHWVVGAAAWDRAIAPHARDRASFIPPLPGLLEATGRLERVVGPRSAVLGDLVRFHTSDGHTPGLVLAELAGPDGPVVFAADLIPGRPWVHVPITMGYDPLPRAADRGEAGAPGRPPRPRWSPVLHPRPVDRDRSDRARRPRPVPHGRRSRDAVAARYGWTSPPIEPLGDQVRA
jgi:glyoxylase-like metal-dependent hydrolase (beta-lactamase superfamily II)